MEINNLIKYYDTRIETLDQKLGSIDRGFSDSTFLDVRKLLVHSSSKQSIPTNVTYFADDGFYADTKIENFEYRYGSEWEFFSRIIQPNYMELLSQDPKLQASMQKTHIHFWMSKGGLTVGNSVFSHFSRYMFIEKMNEEVFKDLIDSTLALNEETVSMNSASSIDHNSLERLSSLYREDKVGLLLPVVLSNLLVPDAGASFALMKSQKIGNILYLKALNILKDVEIDGRIFHKYSIVREVWSISTNNNFYMIQIFIPSEGKILRAQESSETAAWLQRLAIVAD